MYLFAKTLISYFDMQNPVQRLSILEATRSSISSPPAKEEIGMFSPSMLSTSQMVEPLPTAPTSHGHTQECEMHDDDNQVERAHVNSSTRGRRRNSSLWFGRSFNPFWLVERFVKGKCKHCHEDFGAKSRGGTTRLSRHLSRCKARAEVNQIVEKLHATITSPNGVVIKDWSFDPNLTSGAC